MSNQQNEDKDPKADVNKEASEKMSRNDDTQNELYRQKQNDVTQSSEAGNIESTKGTTDSLSQEEINERKLKSEQDADFGNEQLQ